MKSLCSHRDTTALLQRLRTLRPETTARWGRMSAHQMVCHLSDCCRMALGEKRVQHTPNLLERTLVKWIALYVPLRWPTGLVTRPEVDQLIDGTRPAVFAADLAQLIALLELTAHHQPVAPPRHPTFGKMSEGDWQRWGYLHADHHLRQFGA
jgi:hypothetical protein